MTFDNETWIIEAGDEVIHQKVEVGYDGLSPVQQLIYCVWVADYGMRNAGDLRTAADLFPRFKDEAERLSTALGLRHIQACFAQPTARLEQDFLTEFDTMCDELKSVG